MALLRPLLTPIMVGAWFGFGTAIAAAQATTVFLPSASLPDLRLYTGSVSLVAAAAFVGALGTRMVGYIQRTGARDPLRLASWLRENTVISLAIPLRLDEIGSLAVFSQNAHGRGEGLITPSTRRLRDHDENQRCPRSAPPCAVCFAEGGGAVRQHFSIYGFLDGS